MDTDWFQTLADPMRIIARIERAIVEDAEGCWVWQHRLDRYGYGAMKVEGRHLGSHRASWLAHRGDIPTGLVVDHLCRNRACANPWHMELVTTKVNSARGAASGGGPGRPRNMPGQHACGTHGREDGYEHAWRDDYIRWVCRPCARERRARWDARKAA